jgi:hypothetical protein
MVAYNKINYFVQALVMGNINISTTSGHLMSVLLTNTLPTSTYQTSTDVAGELAAGNGYSTGGTTFNTTSCVQTAGTLKAIGPAAGVVFTAGPGTIGPFRYPVLADHSTAYGGNPLVIAWYDYGSSITLNSGETFTVTFDPSSGILQIT